MQPPGPGSTTQNPGIHITYPGLLEDSLGLGLLGRDHGALRTSITTTSKPELREQGEGSLGMEHGTHPDPSMRWVSWTLSKAETLSPRTSMHTALVHSYHSPPESLDI